MKQSLSRGAKIHASNRFGVTALQCAAANNHEEVAEYLLKQGANVDAKSNNGWTALIEASSNGHAEIVRLLLKSGARVDYRDKYGETALSRHTKRPRGGVKSSVGTRCHRMNRHGHEGNGDTGASRKNGGVRPLLGSVTRRNGNPITGLNLRVACLRDPLRPFVNSGSLEKSKTECPSTSESTTERGRVEIDGQVPEGGLFLYTFVPRVEG